MFGKLKKKLTEKITDKIAEVSPIDLDTIKAGIDSAKSKAIEKVTAVDYATIPERLELIPAQLEYEKRHAMDLIFVLNEASEQYKLSSSENKEDEFVSYISDNIDIVKTLDVMEPVWEYVPYGSVIKTGLNFIVKKKKKK